MNGRSRSLLQGVILVCVIILAFAAIVGAVGSFATVYQIRQTQVTNTSTNNNTNETLHLMRSCVTPGQPCYNRGQRQTADAVNNINRVVIYAAACAAQPGHQTVEQIQSCVIQQLAAHRETN